MTDNLITTEQKTYSFDNGDNVLIVTYKEGDEGPHVHLEAFIGTGLCIYCDLEFDEHKLKGRNFFNHLNEGIAKKLYNEVKALYDKEQL